MATPVKTLAASLKPLAPRGWFIEGSGRPTANVPTVVVKLQQLRVRKLPQAPVAKLEVDIRATITVPGDVTEVVEQKLDDQLIEFLFALSSLNCKYGEAEKVIAEGRLGYDLTINVLAEPKE